MQCLCLSTSFRCFVPTVRLYLIICMSHPLWSHPIHSVKLESKSNYEKSIFVAKKLISYKLFNLRSKFIVQMGSPECFRMQHHASDRIDHSANVRMQFILFCICPNKFLLAIMQLSDFNGHYSTFRIAYKLSNSKHLWIFEGLRSFINL